MYSWKWVSFALCLVSVPLRVSADPPEHANKRADMLEGLRAGQGNLNAATQRLEQAATMRERAEQARSRAWTRWKAKLLTEDAIDPKVQRELEKHARREAKLQRLGALAQQAGDKQALERLAKLQALEASLHEKHMQALMAKPVRAAKGPAQP